MSEKRIDATEWRGLVVGVDDDTEVFFGTETGETVTLRIPPSAAYEMIRGLISALGTVHRSLAGSQALVGVARWKMETPDPAVDSTILHVETESGPVLALALARPQLQQIQALSARRLEELDQPRPPRPPGSSALN